MPPRSTAPGAASCSARQACRSASASRSGPIVGKFANPPLVQFDALAAASGAISKASDSFDFDSDDDGIDERHKFERRPLYIELRLADGAHCRVVGLHLKNKGIFSAYEWSKWWALAGANRMKLLAQCRRFRQLFLDAYLSDAAIRGVPLLVCGDINDGPGFDTSEMRLKASAVETLMGSVWRPELCLGNALFDALPVKDQQALDFEDLATTRFSDPIFNDTFHKVWIDHICIRATATAPGSRTARCTRAWATKRSGAPFRSPPTTIRSRRR